MYIQHYEKGSATSAWLRLARELEAAEDFPLASGPAQPEPASALPLPLQEAA